MSIRSMADRKGNAMSVSERQDKVQSSKADVSNFTQYDRGGQIDVDKQENISSPRARFRSASRALASVAVALIAGLGMLPFLGSTAFAAGTSVSGPSLSVNPTTAGSTTAIYTVGFTTSSSGALTEGVSTITLSFPGPQSSSLGTIGTEFPTSSESDYTVNGAVVGTSSLSVCSSTTTTDCYSNSTTVGTPSTVTITVPANIGASTAVTVVVNDVTNLSTPGTYTSATVATSADTVPATLPAFTITPAPTNVTLVSCCSISASTGLPLAGTSSALSNPSPDFSGQAATYALSFMTSSSTTANPSGGALKAGSGTITVAAPTGTVFPSSATDYVVNGVAASSVTGGGTDTATVTTPVAVPADGTVDLVVSGVTNPAATPSTCTASAQSTCDTLTVNTSADTKPQTFVPPNEYAILPAATAVTNIVGYALNSSQQPESGNPTPNGISTPTTPTKATYGISFTTSASGALASGSGTITLTAPTGTSFPSSGSDYSVNGAGPVTIASGGGSDTVTFDTPVAIGNSSNVSIVVTDVTNPLTSSTTDSISVNTSSDLEPVPGPDYTISSIVTGLSVSPSGDVAGATGIYTVGFTTSAVGALAAGSGTITLTAPSGTVFPSSASDYTVSPTSSSTAAAVPASSVSGGGTDSVTIVTPVAIGNDSPVTITIADVTNPPVSTTSNTLSATTSSDKATATASYPSTVAAASNEVSNVTFSQSSTLAAAQGVTYTVKFTTSSATASSTTPYNLVAGTSTITIAVPVGATTLDDTGGTVTVNGQTATTVSSAGTASIEITSPVNVGPNSAVTVVITNSTNPSVGNYTGTVETSTDDNTVPASSQYYVIGTPTTSVGSTDVTATPSYGGESAQYAYSFTTSSSGELSAGVGTIMLTSNATTGTVFPSSASDYVVNGVVATNVVVDPGSSTCTSPCAVITTPVSIGASTASYVVVNSATNPAASNTKVGFGIFTDADPVAPAQNKIAFTQAPTSITNLSGPNATPSSVSATSKWTFSFTTSSATVSGSTYNLVGGTSTITVDLGSTAPAGSLPTTVTDYVVNGVAVASFGSAGCTSSECTVEVPINVSPGGTVTLVINGVTNTSTAGTTYTATVETSTDNNPVTTSEFAIGTAVSSVSLPPGTTYPYLSTNPNPELAGASNAEYAVSFTTSSTGSLSAGSGKITISIPGATLPGTASDYTVNGVSASTVSVSGSSVTITTPIAIGDSDSATVVIVGATNPSASTSNTVTVSTSSDLIPSTPAIFTTGSEVSNVTGPNPTPATDGATATYTIDFVTSATGALSTTSSPAGTITLIAPSDTTWPSSGSSYVVNNVAVASSGAILSKVNGSSTDNEVVITSPVNVADSGSVSMTISGVTNPASGTGDVIEVSTSQDVASVPTPTYTIGSSVSSTNSTGCPTGVSTCPTVSVNPAVGDESAAYTTTFSVSSTGALAAGTGTITVAAPSGTTFPSSGADYIVTIVTSGSTSGSATSVSGGGTDTVTITTPVAIADGAQVTLTLNGVNNPAPGTYNLMINTSSDLIAAATEQYTLATPPAPTVTAVSPTSGPTTGGTAVTITGTNFVSGATVDFGTVAATNVTVVSATSITATSPAAETGTVDVTVSENGLTSGKVSADQFTYEAAYTAITPTRICDTRSGNPSNLSGAEAQCNGKTLAPNKPLDVTVAGIAGVPSSGVSAVVMNVTALNEATIGYVSVYPAGASQPATSNLNFMAGQTTANLVEVGVGSNGQVSIVSNTSTDVVVDLEGYYSVPSAAGQGLYNGITPARICDTRSGNPSNLAGNVAQCNGKTLSPNTPLTVQVTGNGGVPSSGVTAVALNVTAVGYTSGGYLTVYPANLSTPPVVSNVNFAPGDGPVPNRVIVPVSSTGQIDLVSNTMTNALVDVSGYFTAASSTASGSQFNAESTPVRIVDTRCAASSPPAFCSTENIPAANSSLGTLSAGKTITVQVSGLAGVPTGATAVAVNVTATDTTANGFLSVNPAATPPTTSDLNWMAGHTVANLVIAKLSSTGTITIYNNTGSADVIVDVMGWYM